MQVSRALIRRAAVIFVPLAVLAVCALGAVYAVAQQGLRLGADEAPLTLAEDAARALNAGTPPASVVSSGPWVGTAPVDVAVSLSPFIAVFDAKGAVLATNGSLDGGNPVPPAGVLATAAATGQDRVTWQPRPGVRLATVTVRWTGGTVMVGRSLREVERRLDVLLLDIAAGLAATLVALGFASLLAAALAGPDRRPSDIA